MSLILDALKKLEREKQTTPRGFLVVAPGAWAGHGRGALLVAGSLLVGLVLGGLLISGYGRITQGVVPETTVTTETAARGQVASGSSPSTTLAATPPAPVRATAPPAAAPRARPARSVPAGAPTTTSAETASADAPASGPRLQAISEQDGHPVAVIDERVVREGDEWDGIKILRIGAAEVEIEHLGKRRVLRF